MAERVLTLRELNRAALACQLLLERRRLSPKAVVERLVDGLVAGTWSAEDGRVAIEPFETLPRSAGRELEHERSRLEAFLAG